MAWCALSRVNTGFATKRSRWNSHFSFSVEWLGWDYRQDVMLVRTYWVVVLNILASIIILRSWIETSEVVVARNSEWCSICISSKELACFSELCCLARYRLAIAECPVAWHRVRLKQALVNERLKLCATSCCSIILSELVSLADKPHLANIWNRVRLKLYSRRKHWIFNW